MAVFRPRAGVELTVVFDGRGTPNRIFTIDHVIPRSCKVSRNGYHEADTWHLEFDARVLPLDPEGIASLAVRIYMWDSHGDEKKEWQISDNEMIVGLADEDTLSVGKDQHVTCSGRDYTGILDQEWDTKIRVPAGVPLDQAVQFVADKAAPPGTTARFKVLWTASVSPVRSFGAARSTKANGGWIKPGKTTWEVIYDLCIQHGFIVFIRGTTIHISDPRVQTLETLSSAPKIVYGRDVINFSVHRKLAKERVPQLRLVYWDAKARQRFEVIYPQKGVKITTGLGVKKNEIETIPAPPFCHDRESALRFAKMRWELLSRCESTYKVKTRHLRVPIRTTEHVPETGETFDLADDFDLLKLREGSAVGVDFDPFLGDTMRSMDFAARVQFLLSLGYPPVLCSFISTNYDKLQQFKQPYYVRRIDFDFSSKDAMEIEIEAVNFAFERREIAFADSFDPNANTSSDLPDAVSGA